MTLFDLLDRHPELGVAVLTFIPATIGAISALRNGIRGTQTREILTAGIRLSDNNSKGVMASVESVKHDLRNGGGAAVAQKTADCIKKTLPQVVESVIAEKTGSWDGIERRTGLPDRRGK